MGLGRGRSSLLLSGALILVAAGVPPACSGGNDAADGKSATSTMLPATTAPTTTTSSPPSSAATSDLRVIEVTAADYKFEGIPASVPDGSRFSLTNSSPSELHEMLVFRLKADEQRPMSELVKLPDDELPSLVEGPPVALMMAMPNRGEMIPALGDGTVSGPGRYAVICTIPTGADPQAYLAAAEAAGPGGPDVAGGPSHMLNGMFAEFTIE